MLESDLNFFKEITLSLSYYFMVEILLGIWQSVKLGNAKVGTNAQNWSKNAWINLYSAARPFRLLALEDLVLN